MTQRRGNGLLADAYVPLILLAPSHADLMLEALRRSGIAAYAVPLEEDVLEPTGGQVEDPPTDHLYVDADERGAAEQVLGSELPEVTGSDLLAPRSESRSDADDEQEHGQESASAKDAGEPSVGGDLLDVPATDLADGADRRGDKGEDEVWNDLVARFYDDAEPPGEQRGRVAWPDAENLAAPDERQTALGDILANLPRDPDEDDDESREEDRRRAEAEREGHYEPPPPPPLIQGDRVGVAAWFGLLGVPTLLFGAAFLGVSLPNWMMLLGVLMFLGSFVVLILRMTDSRAPGDNGPDDGAVV
ncbi:hypothetical protein [Nocardiopsis sp. MG754419]|uniref:hypothetical protein n=1 Tax=Nocardiopsis sp. MG754419 TaxID=2259865 RepID=UPI001BA4FD4E|nr:hypothetical protein [Nocardiopsis sp. MG754419]MBR8742415.1 hypothetical protein [Nocardiopsis sp. MG754419]